MKLVYKTNNNYLMRILLKISIVLSFVLATNLGLSQTHLPFVKNDFATALNLYETQNYVCAQEKFNTIMNSDIRSEIKVDAEFYAAICAIELFNKDAEYLITKFIENHPESGKVKLAYFQMGRYLYRTKKFSKAIKWFEKVDKYDLSTDELSEYYFKSGYSYFVIEKTKKASKLFYELMNSESEYSDAALYYYSHISYLNRNYQTALKGFTKLSDMEQFSEVVPYYMTQIYYQQEKYNEVIDYAPSLLDSATTNRYHEIARLIGESYYRINDFKNAIPYLEIYKEKSQSYTREDHYELGYAYYRTQQYDKAISDLDKAARQKDALSQNAFYTLADTYLHKGNKKAARAAFYSVSELNFDKELQEDALFSYAKLTYELSFSPFNEAIKAFNKYIELYPENNRKKEAYNFLVNAYMTTKNYKDALISLKPIKDDNDQTMEAYQRLTYFRGLELLNMLKFKSALKWFTKSLYYSDYNATIKTNTYYWKAETFYRLQKYKKAIDEYKRFLVSPGALASTNYNNAYFNMGYAYFELKEYNKANIEFRKFTRKEKNIKNKKVGEAFLRLGDCYFITRNFLDATGYYESAIKSKANNIDYGMFQIAASYGIIKKYNDKISILNDLLEDFPHSTYYEPSSYELAKTYWMIDSIDIAIEKYKTLVANYNVGDKRTSKYIKKALLDLGLIYNNLGRDEDAIAAYLKIVNDFKGSDEISQAVGGLKRIYTEQSKIGVLNKLLASNGIKLEDSEKDTLTFSGARNTYMKGDYDIAKTQLKQYISDFPTGKFAVEASFYLGDCYFLSKDYNNALTSFNVVTAHPQNAFTEQSLIKTAAINFMHKDYSKAYNDYSRLEKIAEYKSNLEIARIGMMRTSYLQKNFIHSIDAAKNTLKIDGIAEELTREANYILAKSYYAENDFENALIKYIIISKDIKSKEGAEAKYMIIKIYFDKKDYDKAQQEIYDFVAKNTSHQDWLAKSFIILANILEDSGDSFQAKHTLYSIIQNYTGDDRSIVDSANDKLIDIIESEEADSQLQEAIDFEINFDDNTENIKEDIFKQEETNSADTLDQGESIIKDIENKKIEN